MPEIGRADRTPRRKSLRSRSGRVSVDVRIFKAATKASPTQCVDAADATRLDASHSKHVSVAKAKNANSNRVVHVRRAAMQ